MLEQQLLQGLCPAGQVLLQLSHLLATRGQLSCGSLKLTLRLGLPGLSLTQLHTCAGQQGSQLGVPLEQACVQLAT
jgi:hypothetical protein